MFGILDVCQTTGSTGSIRKCFFNELYLTIKKYRDVEIFFYILHESIGTKAFLNILKQRFPGLEWADGISHDLYGGGRREGSSGRISAGMGQRPYRRQGEGGAKIQAAAVFDVIENISGLGVRAHTHTHTNTYAFLYLPVYTC